MTDEERKLLTEYLGEPYWEDNGKLYRGGLYVGKDGIADIIEIRTFTTADDMMAVKDRMVVKDRILERKDWNNFIGWSIGKFNKEEPHWKSRFDEAEPYDAEFMIELFRWLMVPARFCELAADWRRG